ncbi:MAG: RHS repeat-associated core domain-containing protein [Candidatus Obscuribacter sp.]|nr:RHS repeat-associated core domain-containing protein [Candidatus Obscuribacter sp.]
MFVCFRQYSSLLARWLNRDPIGENGGVNLNGYCGNSPITWSDPTGLLWEQENRVNCLGSACGRGHWAGPDEGKSVASAMSEMGYSCTKIDPPADSKSCDCKGQDTVLLTFGPENDMKDPYNDPFHYDPENFSNDFHAFHLKSRGINGKQDQWQVQNGDAAKGSPEDNFRTFDGMPEGERTFIPFSSIYCCCKCPSAGKGGK